MRAVAQKTDGNSADYFREAAGGPAQALALPRPRQEGPRRRGVTGGAAHSQRVVLAVPGEAGQDAGSSHPRDRPGCRGPESGTAFGEISVRSPDRGLAQAIPINAQWFCHESPVDD
jgi:hypothetical protein